MPIQITCPGCQTPYKLPDSMNGKKARCAKCQRVMLVAPAVTLELEADDEAVEQPPPRVADAKPAKQQVEEVEDEEPVVRVRRRKSEEDEDEGEPEEEEVARRARPRKKKRRAKGNSWGRNLYRVALYQKTVLFCVLFNIIMVLTIGFFSEALPIIGILAIGVSLVSTFFLFLLTKELFGWAPAVLLSLLDLAIILVPLLLQSFLALAAIFYIFLRLVALVLLLIINGAATRCLKASGVRVGLLGANLSEAERANDG
jgi:predicted Zn finger-like uncharacterized protein